MTGFDMVSHTHGRFKEDRINGIANGNAGMCGSDAHMLFWHGTEHACCYTRKKGVNHNAGCQYYGQLTREEYSTIWDVYHTIEPFRGGGNLFGHGCSRWCVYADTGAVYAGYYCALGFRFANSNDWQSTGS